MFNISSHYQNRVQEFVCIYYSTPRPFSRPLKSSSLPSFINGLAPRHLLSLGLMQYQTGHHLAGRSIVLVHAANRSNDTLALAIYIITHRIITCRERWCLRDLITYAILCVHRLNRGGGENFWVGVQSRARFARISVRNTMSGTALVPRLASFRISSNEEEVPKNIRVAEAKREG